MVAVERKMRKDTDKPCACQIFVFHELRNADGSVEFRSKSEKAGYGLKVGCGMRNGGVRALCWTFVCETTLSSLV